MEVHESQIHLYGCADVTPVPGLDAVKVTDLVEKPDTDSAPSNLAVIGRYVLDPAVFEVLRNTAPGRGDEIQLTDALKTLAHMDPGRGWGRARSGVQGRRYDTGTSSPYLQATVRLASAREDPGPEFRTWLREFVGSKEFAED